MFGIAALFLGACDSASQARIEGTFAYFPNDSLTLYRLNLSNLIPIDTIVTNHRGYFSTRIKTKEGIPEFYYIGARGETMASLLVLSGDRIFVSVDSSKRIHSIVGSPESQLLHEVEVGMTLARHQYDSLMTLFLQSDPNSTEAIALNYALGAVYVKQKQAAIRFIFTHPSSMASVHVLFQHFSDDVPLFADSKDAIYFEHLYDSLRLLYPKSPYIAALIDQSAIRKKQMEISDKLLNAQELGFPDIVLPDVKAQPVALSLLKGKVIILSFWTSQDPLQKMANQDFMELYRKYASKGLAIYQVALDSDKTAWARTVAEQEIPWVSVCDGYGFSSVAATLYAVSKLPTHFLIDKNGELAGRDYTMDQLATEVARLCL